MSADCKHGARVLDSACADVSHSAVVLDFCAVRLERLTDQIVAAPSAWWRRDSPHS